nr:hypothetical protein RNT25_00261 [arsenite-oxidising bacterium NT-25]
MLTVRLGRSVTRRLDMPNTDKNTQQDQKKAGQAASQSSGKEKGRPADAGQKSATEPDQVKDLKH